MSLIQENMKTRIILICLLKCTLGATKIQYNYKCKYVMPQRVINIGIYILYLNNESGEERTDNRFLPHAIRHLHVHPLYWIKILQTALELPFSNSL